MRTGHRILRNSHAESKLEANRRADAEAIRAHVTAHADQGHISKYGVPDQVHFLENLDRTSVGKLNKRAMREKLTQGEGFR